MDSSWRVIGKSVRGASHVRTNLPNQDAIGWLPAEGAGPPLVVVVSDGHGSAKSFRSDRGARMAVEAVQGELHDLFGGGEVDPKTLAAVRRQATEQLPQTLVRRWADAVTADLEKEPLAAEELESLEKREGVAARQKVEANPLLVYGATVVAVLVTRGFILYLQLGDGDILVVSEKVEVSRPMAHDARLMANETTSLCSRHADREVRVVLQPLGDGGPPAVPAPAMILISTDGYANSFKDEAGFRQVGSDILEMICDDGLDQIDKDVESWLIDASKVGSGDDITLGLLCRSEALEGCRAELARRKATPAPDGGGTLAVAAAAMATAAAATASAAAATANAAAATASAAAAIAQPKPPDDGNKR